MGAGPLVAVTDSRQERVREPAVSEQTALPSITAFRSDKTMWENLSGRESSVHD